MQIERVGIEPSKDMYNPGEVINIAVYFQAPFIGQCEVGFAPVDQSSGDDDLRGTPFAKSTNRLYEGQIYVKEADIGARRLLARLMPVRGERRTLSVGDRIFEVRPLVPLKR